MLILTVKSPYISTHLTVKPKFEYQSPVTIYVFVITIYITTGWWFGKLVGGLEREFYFSIQLGMS